MTREPRAIYEGLIELSQELVYLLQPDAMLRDDDDPAFRRGIQALMEACEIVLAHTSEPPPDLEQIKREAKREVEYHILNAIHVRARELEVAANDDQNSAPGRQQFGYAAAVLNALRKDLRAGRL